MIREKDLLFVSQEYENFIIPKNKKYLLKYFDTDLQKSFLKYYLVFGSWSNFVEHTGLICQSRWLTKLEEKFIALEAAHAQAKKDMDMTTLAKIESGKFK